MNTKSLFIASVLIFALIATAMAVENGIARDNLKELNVAFVGSNDARDVSGVSIVARPAGEMSKSSPEMISTGGFEILLAAAGLLLVVYFVRR
ncbi:PGF-CTERM sorting domain-containing protein [Methanolapillus millepedarum]|uniref:PGF-CTERM archaeal protein-sorting signal domain-containing protein n=1 Tax=Methanolapillus millepedarum TaxID=3028296 RepID=A0AA96V383_9EURY|nr:hypothetical protein MsAc7_08190 [Methanosarcinaceae archaeon Ac7]